MEDNSNGTRSKKNYKGIMWTVMGMNYIINVVIEDFSMQKV